MEPSALRPNRNILPRFIQYSLGLALACCGAINSSTAEEYTPDSPKVKSMIGLAVANLESKIAEPLKNGYECLVGYAIFKATENPDHPWVLRGIAQADSILRDATTKNQNTEADEFLYAVSVAIQLLAAVDPIKYSPQLQGLFTYIKSRQREDGGFGYNRSPAVGDTSQTQYATLAMWSLDHAQIDVPKEMIEKTLKWLRENQRDDGGYTYQNPSGDAPYHQMTAAGMSATMICADMLGILRAGGGSAMASLDGEKENADLGVPAAFRRVIEKAEDKSSFSQGDVVNIAQRANGWIEANPYMRGSQYSWHYYWIYSLERYQSFLEAMKGKREKSPQWYNDLVDELASNQMEIGSWGQKDPDNGSIESSTAFGILVLVRATQKSIGELSEAMLTGGEGLGKDMSAVDLSQGKVEERQELSDIEAALKMLEETTFETDKSEDIARRIRLDADPVKRNAQLERFARLVRSNSAVSRRVAARVLCRGDNLDMVPYLIYALSDPDALTNIAAESSLRVLSRQLSTYKIPKQPPEGKLEFPVVTRVEAQAYWKAWYLTIRPDYIFLEGS
jgi:hypothetical protein